ncbi:MAG: helix-turn-helix domain-containing protein [Luteibacter sp.]|uniref:helix-turn-helix domain-containing protein n=1 Tax=Luteibacter sp. TaxID=1886636 RepID=UPI002809392A|nr:helix-turn-helix domain-containing protein [Luteibacter sp.]MDQ7995278.1 helix-turn-helix domain-containing protein [Luteibacter sp.]
MNFEAIKKNAQELIRSAEYLNRISTDNDYQKALVLVEELIDEDYEGQRLLIEVLSRNIEEWENRAPEFAEFNARVAKLDDTAVLRLLMEQHNLGVADLPELGQKSLISRILNGERSLTKAHIQALADRFGVSPAIFFSNVREKVSHDLNVLTVEQLTAVVRQVVREEISDQLHHAA